MNNKKEESREVDPKKILDYLGFSLSDLNRHLTVPYSTFHLILIQLRSWVFIPSLPLRGL